MKYPSQPNTPGNVPSKFVDHVESDYQYSYVNKKIISDKSQEWDTVPIYNHEHIIQTFQKGSFEEQEKYMLRNWLVEVHELIIFRVSELLSEDKLDQIEMKVFISNSILTNIERFLTAIDKHLPETALQQMMRFINVESELIVTNISDRLPIKPFRRVSNKMYKAISSLEENRKQFT